MQAYAGNSRVLEKPTTASPDVNKFFDAHGKTHSLICYIISVKCVSFAVLSNSILKES